MTFLVTCVGALVVTVALIALPTLLIMCIDGGSIWRYLTRKQP